jgi:uncharacterized protein with NAD-binding domain and iron-sulfur cluster
MADPEARAPRRTLTRRAFLAGGAAAAVTARGSAARAAERLSRRRETVAVLGGGIAGLTAAHELVERGFDVTVYEAVAWGGKARSTQVPGSAAGGRRPLPGEHAYRVPFGFYQNLPDTMQRIPFGANPRGVFDNLVPAPQVTFMRADKSSLSLPLASLDPRPLTPDQVVDTLQGLLLEQQLPPDAAAYFAARMAVYLSSCDARRRSEWERASWTDFIGTDRFGADYTRILGALPQFTQASRAEDTAAAYIADFLELMVYSLLGLGSNGPAVRVLNAPTNEAFVDPWTAHLRQLGVHLRLGHQVTGLALDGGRIVGASVSSPEGTLTAAADWYVCALPVERARALWTSQIRAADSRLAAMDRLGVAWMNGISFFLTRRTSIVEGHALCLDSPWDMSFVPQAQFWSRDFARTYGDGNVHDKISVAVANWTTPGTIVRKAAEACTPEEVIREVWGQLQRHVNRPGRVLLSDDMLHSYEIDPGMHLRDGHLVSTDPLVLPTAGTFPLRPDVVTQIPNLVLCGDYLKGSWIITTMEAACHTGRRAANAILDASGSSESPASEIEPYRPPEWEPLKRVDARRHRAGLPNLLDQPVLDDVTSRLLRS